MQITVCACVAIVGSVYTAIQDAQSRLYDFNVASNLTVCDTTPVLSGTLTKELDYDAQFVIFIVLYMFCIAAVCAPPPHKHGLPFVVASLIGFCLVPIFMALPVRDSLVNVSSRAMDFEYRYNMVTACPPNMRGVEFYMASTSGFPSDICHSQAEYFKHCTYAKSRKGFVHTCCASFKPGLDHIDDMYLDVFETLTLSCFTFVLIILSFAICNRVRR